VLIMTPVGLPPRQNASNVIIVLKFFSELKRRASQPSRAILNGSREMSLPEDVSQSLQGSATTSVSWNAKRASDIKPLRSASTHTRSAT
jgi:hypothetical protein